MHRSRSTCTCSRSLSLRESTRRILPASSCHGAIFPGVGCWRSSPTGPSGAYSTLELVLLPPYLHSNPSICSILNTSSCIFLSLDKPNAEYRPFYELHGSPLQTPIQFHTQHSTFPFHTSLCCSRTFANTVYNTPCQGQKREFLHFSSRVLHLESGG